ncbi:uncharacterized protein [Acropora muricata]|uniref:uncharacterized protein LOC114955278 n=1 Tax=Acropora millepora TaxID=45264 RepID=UPI0010FCA9DC|nr:uncharacterized protein LOC114955278 [Acropora millepora]
MESLRKGYQTRIREDMMSAAGESRIKLYQEYFQKKDGLPVHLKGSYRIPATRFLLWGVGVGCLLTVGCIGLMATNNLPKRQR